ncbi:MAG TPA: hypothetical protein PKE69_19015 [Pyrinomonadaceae bacterium]|nr:hypothetical protein [Pyrinomonadaceae bacterium]
MPIYMKIEGVTGSVESSGNAGGLKKGWNRDACIKQHKYV